MKNSFLVTLLLLALFLTYTSCKKKSIDDIGTTPPEYDTQSMQDNALAENTWSDKGAMSDEAATQDSLSSYRPENSSSLLASSCAHVTIDTSITPHVATIDFQSSWCLCSDGRYRKGKFTISWTGPYRAQGTVITITATDADNYYVSYYNNMILFIKVVGTRTVTNNGLNANNNPTFRVLVSSNFTNAGQSVMTWTSDRIREWVNGDSTLAWNDDKYSITDNNVSSSGTSFEGKNYTVSITSPLFIDFSCPFSTCKITKGVIK